MIGGCSNPCGLGSSLSLGAPLDFRSTQIPKSTNGAAITAPTTPFEYLADPDRDAFPAAALYACEDHAPLVVASVPPPADGQKNELHYIHM